MKQEKNQKKDRFYVAYGSNLNLEQMARRCPTATVAGIATLDGWRLMFRGGENSAVATIEPSAGDSVPVLVWRLQPEDERRLDLYEGYPSLYHKEPLRILLDGRRVPAMVYVMNEERYPYGSPSGRYFAAIRAGYVSAGFDVGILEQARENSKQQEGGHTMDQRVREQILAIRETGETNMLDIRMVQVIANREGFYELVIYLEEHRPEYVNFIMTGRTTEEA